MKTARLSIGISLLLVCLVALLFYFFVDIEVVRLQLRGANPGYLALAALLLLAGFAVFAVRWRLLLDRLPSLPGTFHAANLGHLLNMLLPLRLGEAMRIVALNSTSGVGVGLLTSSVVIERMLDALTRLAAFGGVLMIGIGFANSTLMIAGLAIFLFTALIALVWMIRNRDKLLRYIPRYLGRLPRLSEQRLHRLLAELLDALESISSPRSLGIGLLTSVLSASLFLGFHYFSLLALNLPLSQAQMWALSLGILAISPPSSPTLPGVYHVQLVPFVAMGIQGNHLAAYGILLHAMESVAIIGLSALALVKTGSSLGELLRRRQPAPVPVEIDIFPSEKH